MAPRCTLQMMAPFIANISNPGASATLSAHFRCEAPEHGAQTRSLVWQSQVWAPDTEIYCLKTNSYCLGHKKISVELIYIRQDADRRTEHELKIFLSRKQAKLSLMEFIRPLLNSKCLNPQKWHLRQKFYYCQWSNIYFYEFLDTMTIANFLYYRKDLSWF